MGRLPLVLDRLPNALKKQVVTAGFDKSDPAVSRPRAAALLFQGQPEPARQWWIFRDRRSNLRAKAEVLQRHLGAIDGAWKKESGRCLRVYTGAYAALRGALETRPRTRDARAIERKPHADRVE